MKLLLCLSTLSFATSHKLYQITEEKPQIGMSNRSNCCTAKRAADKRWESAVMVGMANPARGVSQTTFESLPLDNNEDSESEILGTKPHALSEIFRSTSTRQSHHSMVDSSLASSEQDYSKNTVASFEDGDSVFPFDMRKADIEKIFAGLEKQDPSFRNFELFWNQYEKAADEKKQMCLIARMMRNTKWPTQEVLHFFKRVWPKFLNSTKFDRLERFDFLYKFLTESYASNAEKICAQYVERVGYFRGTGSKIPIDYLLHKCKDMTSAKEFCFWLCTTSVIGRDGCERSFKEIIDHVEEIKNATDHPLLESELVKDLIQNGCELIENKYCWVCKNFIRNHADTEEAIWRGFIPCSILLSYGEKKMNKAATRTSPFRAYTHNSKPDRRRTI